MESTRKIGLQSGKLLPIVRELLQSHRYLRFDDDRIDAVRQPSSNSPLPENSLTTPFMACNDRGTTEVPGILKVTAGDTIEPTCTSPIILDR